MLHKRLKNIVDEAIRRQVATHISLFVGFGFKDTPKDIEIVSGRALKDTIYDLASITKISGTTIAVAEAVVENKISLDEKPFSWPITIRSILAHTSGLPAHKRFYEDFDLSKKDFPKNLELIKKQLFLIKPGDDKSRIYSDLGFIALGFLLSERMKKPLTEIFLDSKRYVAHNLFCTDSKSPFYQEPRNFAPTGFCHARENLVLGQVHDPNCFFMGGHGGHAGQFGVLTDIKLMGQFFLSAYKEPTTPLKDMIAFFAKNGLGFDKRSHTGTQRHLSPNAFGHFGYTGTSLWIDPNQNGLIIALLTNRVHTNKEQLGIFRLRLAINQAIKEYS